MCVISIQTHEVLHKQIHTLSICIVIRAGTGSSRHAVDVTGDVPWQGRDGQDRRRGAVALALVHYIEEGFCLNWWRTRGTLRLSRGHFDLDERRGGRLRRGCGPRPCHTLVDINSLMNGGPGGSGHTNGPGRGARGRAGGNIERSLWSMYRGVAPWSLSLQCDLYLVLHRAFGGHKSPVGNWRLLVGQPRESGGTYGQKHLGRLLDLMLGRTVRGLVCRSGVRRLLVHRCPRCGPGSGLRTLRR